MSLRRMYFRLEAWFWRQVSALLLAFRRSRLYPHWCVLMQWGRRLPPPPRWAWLGAPVFGLLVGMTLGHLGL